MVSLLDLEHTTSMDGVMTDCDSIVTVDFYLRYPQGSNFKGQEAWGYMTPFRHYHYTSKQIIFITMALQVPSIQRHGSG